MQTIRQFVDAFLLDNLDGENKDSDASDIRESTRLIFLMGNKPTVLFKDIAVNRSSFVWKLNSLLAVTPFYRVVRDEVSGTITLIQTRYITKHEVLLFFKSVFKTINFLYGSEEATKALEQYAHLFLATTHEEFDYIDIPDGTYLAWVKADVYNEETDELDPTMFYFYDPFKLQQFEALMEIDFGLTKVPHTFNRTNEKLLSVLRRYASMITIDLPTPEDDMNGKFLHNLEEVLWN